MPAALGLQVTVPLDPLQPVGRPAHAHRRPPEPDEVGRSVKVTAWPTSADARLGEGDASAGSEKTENDVAPLDPLPPFESVTVTLTEKLPEALTVHVMEAVVGAIGQPVGKPLQAKVNPPDPPAAAAPKLTSCPTSADAAEGDRETVGSASTTNNRVLLV